MTGALWLRYYSKVLFTFAGVGLNGLSVKLELNSAEQETLDRRG